MAVPLEHAMQALDVDVGHRVRLAEGHAHDGQRLTAHGIFLMHTPRVMAAPNPASEAIVMDGSETASGAGLFLASTPLHTFFALGLMAGPMRQAPKHLWLIDQPPGGRDYLGEALEKSGAIDVKVTRFAALRGTAAARGQLIEMSALAARIAPATIAVGMDH